MSFTRKNSKLSRDTLMEEAVAHATCSFPGDSGICVYHGPKAGAPSFTMPLTMPSHPSKRKVHPPSLFAKQPATLIFYL
ncbi:hypothetical protein VUR80DRAFT_7401 [Thermomyces stellatus]